MDTSFIYDTYVTDRNFVGRKQDVQRFVNLLVSGESVAVYGEPGCGKMSLIRETLVQSRFQGINLHLAHVDFTRARKTEDVITAFASGILKAFASSPSEFREMIEKYLAGTHLVFDREQFDMKGDVICANWLVDEIDAAKVFSLPSGIAEDRFRANAVSPAVEDKIVVLVTQFQSIMFAGEQYMLLKQLEKAVVESGRKCIFIFTGSHLNAMREIFDKQKWFWRSVDRFEISPVQPSEISDYVFRIFQNSGKVIDKELIARTSQMLRCNSRYVNHLFSIVNSISRGFVNKTEIDAAMDRLVAIHRPRFFSTVCSLTDFQLSLLRAIMAGEVKFSSSAIIDKYQLNSSANVNRIKDALVKKEIVWFDDKDEPHVIDPLFEYWLAKEYFAF